VNEKNVLMPYLRGNFARSSVDLLYWNLMAVCKTYEDCGGISLLLNSNFILDNLIHKEADTIV
jgi:hypothetical protein